MESEERDSDGPGTVAAAVAAGAVGGDPFSISGAFGRSLIAGGTTATVEVPEENEAEILVPGDRASLATERASRLAASAEKF